MKNHPITRYSMLSDITATTMVTANVSLNDTGAIEHIVLVGARSYTAEVRKA